MDTQTVVLAIRGDAEAFTELRHIYSLTSFCEAFKILLSCYG